MARQDQNAAFSKSSFLYGGNAAYVEQLYDDYRRDPSKVDASWRDFFEGLKDDGELVEKNAEGASWKQRGWPETANGELVSALDGNWHALETAIGGKIRAKAQEAKAREASLAELSHARPSARQSRPPEPRAEARP
jgi:2-oxoglutarate dehydrogenase E1 component